MTKAGAMLTAMLSLMAVVDFTALIVYCIMSGHPFGATVFFFADWAAFNLMLAGIRIWRRS